MRSSLREPSTAIPRRSSSSRGHGRGRGCESRRCPAEKFCTASSASLLMTPANRRVKPPRWCGRSRPQLSASRRSYATLTAAARDRGRRHDHDPLASGRLAPARDIFLGGKDYLPRAVSYTGRSSRDSPDHCAENLENREGARSSRRNAGASSSCVSPWLRCRAAEAVRREPACRPGTPPTRRHPNNRSTPG